MNYDEYLKLLQGFLDGSMSSHDFQQRYLEKFKHESRRLPDHIFELLDGLFGDVDSFCPDVVMRGELDRMNPGYYLDEQALRQRVSAVNSALKDATFDAQANTP